MLQAHESGFPGVLTATTEEEILIALKPPLSNTYFSIMVKEVSLEKIKKLISKQNSLSLLYNNSTKETVITRKYNGHRYSQLDCNVKRKLPIVISSSQEDTSFLVLHSAHLPVGWFPVKGVSTAQLLKEIPKLLEYKGVLRHPNTNRLLGSALSTLGFKSTYPISYHYELLLKGYENVV